MKINIKYLSLCTILGTVSMVSTSCNDLLDLDPVSQITPESYYNNADQLASYLNSSTTVFYSCLSTAACITM